MDSSDDIRRACSISIADDADVSIWTASRDFDGGVVGRCVRSALERLDERWAFELHQFLANGGNAMLLYRLNRDECGAMPLSMGDASGPFGRGLMLGTRVSCEKRVQLGVSMLTAFVVAISQGADPRDVGIDDLGKQIKELNLPVL